MSGGTTSSAATNATAQTGVLSEAVEAIRGASTIRAAAFIVTLYGDVVVPRGGILWIGNVIDICAEVGISESLVRTSVSRLVASGHLVGERHGRRSFYRLSPSALEEFDRASGVIYSGTPAQHDTEWTFVHIGREDMRALGTETLQKAGFGQISAELSAAPGDARGRIDAILGTGPKRPDALVFRARLEAGAPAAALRGFAALNWPLDAQATAYRQFLDLFSPLAKALAGRHARLPDRDCLIARLLLVHEFRRVVLKDPGLPPAALPEDWPGASARHLFAGLYDALTGGADKWIGAHFVDVDGPIVARGAAVKQRLAAIAETLASA